MYPHADSNRRRRVGQLSGQMVPQHSHSPHIIGMQQQTPGVMLPIRSQSVQILQQNQHHYPQPQQYQTNQQHLHQQQQQQQQNSQLYINSGPPPLPPVPTQFHPPSQPQSQLPPQPRYNTNNTQVILTKQAVNHSKHYNRGDYKVIKDMNQTTSSVPLAPVLTDHADNYAAYNQQSFGDEQPPCGAQTLLSTQTSHPTEMNYPESVEKDKEESLQEELNVNEDSDCKEVILPQMGVKEKTPMCLVNELARFNKITHQYRLTNEQGPAHKKCFTVTLTLGREEYTADGPSIKKAQHAAAATALTKTSYQHPAPKHNKFLPIGNMTPTVELNALAMKRGEPAVYKLVEVPTTQTPNYPHPPYGYRRPYAYGMRGGYYGRGGHGRGGMNDEGGGSVRHPTRLSQNYGVMLKVGEKEYLGEGNTPQAARHDAASKALSHLKLLPTPEASIDSEQLPEIDGEQDIDSSIKSPISLVHEIALKRNLNVVFNVISEKGPPHMKIFITQCIVGEFKSEGEGNGKKISKKRAAENMIHELKKLPPIALSPSLACSVSLSRLKRKPPLAKKKTRNLIKVTQEPKQELDTSEEMNPISRLIQIQQVKKEREPVYTLLEEKGMHRRREFIMEVAIGEFKATGSGPNKKIAKKYAAQNLLAIIEGKPPDGGTVINKDETSKLSRQDGPSGSGGRQLAPGLILVNDQHKFPKTTESEALTKTVARETTSAAPAVKIYPKGFGTKDQLLYLSKLLNFEVTFSDFPKANHKEHLTLVSMTTEPSQVCHGSGPTIEEAHNEAAATALRALAAMGLECTSSPVPATEKINL